MVLELATSHGDTEQATMKELEAQDALQRLGSKVGKLQDLVNQTWSQKIGESCRRWEESCRRFDECFNRLMEERRLMQVNQNKNEFKISSKNRSREGSRTYVHGSLSNPYNPNSAYFNPYNFNSGNSGCGNDS
ncbi:hypothetical protein O6P43_026180 [Quillaja saponaria]|uniref:Uncharacterized protein n=1 Tax=Quillaja saponaria TaxID=32244 RepID=A0AAD7LAU8_QUISA|nr:hypothetical protein O6P43_026180 [Quillaja saponaria]